MKKIYILAALLMATTSAHAGSSVSVDIQGKRLGLEMPADCNSPSCLKVTAPDLSGGDSVPTPGPDANRFNDDDDAGPGRAGFHDSMRFDDDDRASGPGRPGFHGGRRYYDDDRAFGPGRPGFDGGRRFHDDDRASGPGRPGFHDGRRFNDDDRAFGPGRPGFDGGRRFNDDDRASGPGRPGFEGGRRFNDDDRASGPGRPGFDGGRRFNDDDRASGPGRPGFDGGRRFNDDDRASGPGRPGFHGGRRYNDDDNYASRPDRAPASLPVPAAPAPPAETVIAATPPVQADVAPPAPAPIRIVPTTPERQPAPAPVAAEPESDPNSPVGTWATEENKGNVRIERCGDNLCGYSAKSGEKVLINMKAQGSKWAGRIHDPDSGRKYDSTMTMKGTNTLRIQGCAFGGIFCGAQTWKRVS